MGFQAFYFDGKTSTPQPVEVFWDTVALTARAEGSLVLSVPLASCVIAPPLGRSRRSIRLPDGGLLETDDAEAVSRLERLTGENRGMRLIHYFESRWKAVTCCVACLLFCFWIFISYGIPFIAKQVASSIPVASMEQVSRDGLKIMDNRFFGPSGLSPQEARKVERIFAMVKRDVGAGYDFRLLMRKGKAIGANAFALPSGVIVVSDELIRKASDERELAGVLAHEMYHVKGRHAVRQILQSAGVFFMISVMTGDIATVSSTAASIPMLLVQTGYSREFEKEADREAALYSIRKGWGIGPYIEMLGKLYKGENQSVSLPFLSTHPTLAERVKHIKELGEKRTP